MNGIAALGGLAALITGIVLRSHYEPLKRVCSSGLGVVGQAFDGAAQQQCSRNSDLAGLGLALIIIGVCCMGLALLNLRETRAIRQHALRLPTRKPEEPS